MVSLVLQLFASSVIDRRTALSGELRIKSAISFCVFENMLYFVRSSDSSAAMGTSSPDGCRFLPLSISQTLAIVYV